MIENVTLIRSILELFKYVRENFLGNVSDAKYKEFIAERLRSHDDQFATLAKEYHSAISDFQKRVAKAISYAEIGEAVIELRSFRNISQLERQRLVGERKAFQSFVATHGKKRLAKLMNILEGYLEACEAYFYSLDDEGTGYQSWATALVREATGEPNFEAIKVGHHGGLDESKQKLRHSTDRALKNMADIAAMIAEGNAKLINFLKFS